MTLACAQAGRCGGCPDYARPLAEQRQSKRDALNATWIGHGLDPAVVASAELLDAGALGFRERLDLRLADGAIGLLSAAGALVPLTTCPLATPPLARWFERFAADLPPIADSTRASVRLRVPPGGLADLTPGADPLGVWIDLGHAQLKALLDEAAWLSRWAPRATIELGPKGRVVHVVDPTGRVVLGEARPAAWSATWIGGQPFPLTSRVMDFGQPGSGPNRVLVAALLAAVRASGARKILELGAGGGNLTLPLAFEAGLDVRALELDTTGLVANAARLSGSGSFARASPSSAAPMRRSGPLEAIAASYERADGVAGWVHGRDAIVCDPARGGLGRFIDGLAKLAPSLRPASIIYVSCHLPALAKDAARLSELGWIARSVSGVDQFPWTPHAEWIARFERA